MPNPRKSITFGLLAASRRFPPCKDGTRETHSHSIRGWSPDREKRDTPGRRTAISGNRSSSSGPKRETVCNTLEKRDPPCEKLLSMLQRKIKGLDLDLEEAPSDHVPGRSSGPLDGKHQRADRPSRRPHSTRQNTRLHLLGCKSSLGALIGLAFPAYHLDAGLDRQFGEGTLRRLVINRPSSPNPQSQSKGRKVGIRPARRFRSSLR